MWNLDLTEIYSSNCIDSMTIAILKYFGYEYQLFHLSDYYAKYLSSENISLSERICKRKPDDKEPILNELFGIKKTSIQANKIIDTYNFIKSEIDFCPIGILSDAFDCFWTPFYQKKRIFHFFLVVSIDEKNKCYICVDVYHPTIGNISIPFNKIEKICNSFEKFNLSQKPEINVNKYLNYVYTNMLLVNKDEIYLDRSIMLKLLGEDLKIEDIGEIDNLNASILLIKIIWIAENKKTFLLALKHIEHLIGRSIFAAVYEYFEKIEQGFVYLKNQLIRSLLLNVVKSNQIKIIINDIYDLDIKIIDCITYAIKNELGEQIR